MPLKKTDKQNAMEIGLRIKMARLRANMTQDEAIKKLGWQHQSRLSQYERGTRRQSIDDINALARVFNVKPAFLLTGHNKTEKESEAAGGVNDSDMLFECIRQVQEEAKSQGVTLTDEQLARVATTIYVEVHKGSEMTQDDVAAAVRYIHKFA